MRNEAIRHLIRDFVAAGRVPTALGEAARWGEYDLLLELLDAGVPVDAVAENGSTALMLAASGGQLKEVKLLLKRGANVNARHLKNGCTPLMWCLMALHSEKVYVAIARELIHAGADVTVTDAEGLDAAALVRVRESARLVELIESAKDRQA